MKIDEFKLERFFARWEFEVPHLLCASDAETWGLDELLALADDESRAMWSDLRLGYTESPGHPLLRSEIADLYESVGAADVLVFAGAQEAVFAVMNVLLRRHDHVVVIWPAYQSLYEVARAIGADVSLVKLRHEDSWTLDLDAVRAVVTSSTKLIVVNYPHSPTGSLISADDFAELARIAEEAGAHLLCDEVYRFMELEERQRLPAGVDAYDGGVSLGVMSKSFGMAGLRIGWLVTKDENLRSSVAAFKDYTTICNAAPSELLSIAALRARDVVLARNRAVMFSNLQVLDAFFERNSERVEWVRPASGTTAFPRLLHGPPIELFADALARKAGVLVLPGTLFDFPGRHFRIGFGRTDFPQALERFETFLRRTDAL